MENLRIHYTDKSGYIWGGMIKQENFSDTLISQYNSSVIVAVFFLHAWKPHMGSEFSRCYAYDLPHKTVLWNRERNLWFFHWLTTSVLTCGFIYESFTRRNFSTARLFDFIWIYLWWQWITIFFPISANERVLIDFKKDGKNPGFIPDGMTIDTDQNLYVATWGGSKIFKIDPKWVVERCFNKIRFVSIF